MNVLNVINVAGEIKPAVEHPYAAIACFQKTVV
jgi:hypothetical protein